MQNTKGKIIVIEGIDGSGKQTQSKLLFNYLQSLGKDVLMQSFPNYPSNSSAPVRMYLDGQLASKAEDVDAYQSSVLYAVDRFCTMKVLSHKITDKTILVFDRYVSSNMLHQGGKIKDKDELIKYLNWLDDFEFNLLKLPKPDIIIFLDISAEKSIELRKQRDKLKSGEKNDIHEKNMSHLYHAYNTGKFIAEMFKWEIINCIDDKGDIKCIEDIQAEIQKTIIKLIE